MSEKDCDDLFKQGEKDIKTGFFKSADHLSGVSNFTDAAKGYRKLNLFDKSIRAFSKAFDCNGQLKDLWSAGTNAQDIAEIYLFNLNNFNQGLEWLKKASFNYKVGGKFSTSIKAFSDLAQKLMEKEKYDAEEAILQEAFNDCMEHPEDQLIRISCENVASKLIDVQCRLEHYTLAIKVVEEMIKVQLQYEENKFKVSKNYIKSAMLRIILDEGYLVKDIISKMYQVQYNDIYEDISDLQKLHKAIETINKKDFTFCIQYAYSLFENNLLKALQKVFQKREAEGVPIVNSSNDINNIAVQELVIDNLSISQNETKATINADDKSTDVNIAGGNGEEEKKNNDSEFL